jgi:hypothetical protein
LLLSSFETLSTRRSDLMVTTARPLRAQEAVFTPTLLLAFELGVSRWKLGSTTGVALRQRECSVTAGAVQAVLEESEHGLG